MDNTTLMQFVIGVTIFCSILMLLVVIVLIAKKLLLISGTVNISINRLPPVTANIGAKLFTVMAEQGIYLDTDCGGKGICGKCRVKVTQGAMPLMEAEAVHITKTEASDGIRLACLLSLKNDLSLSIPESLFARKRTVYKVVSNHLVSTFMTEIELAPVDDSEFTYQPGDHVLLEATNRHVKFKDFNIGEAYLDEWQRYGLTDLEVSIDHNEVRAYSLSNSPTESNNIKLLVRIATPHPNAPAGTPPGKVSSYIFSLKPGEKVTVTGPCGDFHIRENEREMLFIGGGAGMAPLRSMIRYQLMVKNTKRKMTFWYGARSKQQLCYVDEFDRLMKQYDNFEWHTALSEPMPEDNWSGAVGFIHSFVLNDYLAGHPSPESIDYYLCGPPVMTTAVVTMLKGLNVQDENMFCDDFGGGG